MIYFVFEPIQMTIKAAQNVFPDLKAEIQLKRVGNCGYPALIIII
jgi:hypothetical protein